MGQNATETDTTTVLPVIALVLAAAAAGCFGVGDAVGMMSGTAEAVLILTYVLGWGLLFWSAITGGTAAFSLVHRIMSQQPVNRLEAALIAAALALVVVLVATHPLWGSGSATA